MSYRCSQWRRFSLLVLAIWIVLLGVCRAEPWPLGGTFGDAGCEWIEHTMREKSEEALYWRQVARCFHQSPNHDNYATPDLAMFQGVNQTTRLIRCSNSSLLSFDQMKAMLGKLKEDKASVVFVGDSVVKQQVMHFACMLEPATKFVVDEVQDWHEAMGNRRPRELHVGGVHLKSHKIGKIFQNTHLFTPILADELAAAKGPSSIVQANHGLHYNGGGITGGGSDNEKKKGLSVLAEETVQAYSEHVGKGGKTGVPFFTWRETTPQNFNTSNGHFSSKCGSLVCVPLTQEMMAGKREIAYGNGTCCGCQIANIRNAVTSPIIKNSSVPIAISEIYDAMAASPYNLHLTGEKDCTHWASDGLTLVHTVLLSQLRAHLESLK